MMNQAELSLLDATLEHALNLQRFTAGEKKKVLAILEQLQRELKARLYEDLTDFSKRRVNKLLKEATEIIDGTYKGIQGKLDIDGLAKTEATATARTFAAIGLEASIPTEAILRALVSDTLLQGAPLKAWWAKQSESVAFNFANQIRQGIVQGETLQQIIIRVAGSKRLGLPGIMDIARRHASTLVHDSIMTVANNARMAVYKENDDIMKGYRHLSTLDSRTSLVCVARSGATWDMDLKPTGDTSLPFQQTPIHPNCRSLILPILKSYKELGADIEEPPTGTRASDLGQIPSDISFDSFLKRHDKAYQDDLLGPGRADLWRSGKITLSDLVSGSGRELTLDQLKNK